MSRLFIVGHPGLYGGAATELHHQILAWTKMGIDLHIIPTEMGHINEPLYPEMQKLNIKYHEKLDFSEVLRSDAVINFCSGTFLDYLPAIKKKTDRIMFVNCMTWLHKKEIERAPFNLIKYYLYQRTGVLEDHKSKLQALGANGEFLHFTAYFDDSSLEFSCIDQPVTNFGRISRADTDKYSDNINMIYNGIVSPKPKRAHWLGYGPKVHTKIKNEDKWIKKYLNQTELAVKSFYKACDFIVQPTETTENWPRIGFEAMFSGCPLIVDNRGGWQSMIEHGVDGFLCDHHHDFIYYGSRMAYDFEYRSMIALNALNKAKQLSSLDKSIDSWNKIFDKVFN